MSFANKGTAVYSANGIERGEATGAEHHCSMHGCTGVRVTVKWADGKITHPCSKGLKNADGKEPNALQVMS